MLTACSESDEAQNQTEQANAGVCLALEELQASMDGAAETLQSGDVSVQDVQTAQNEIQTAADAVQQETTELDTAVTDQINGATQEYQDAIAALPNASTPEDAQQQLSEAQTDYRSTFSQINETLGCGS